MVQQSPAATSARADTWTRKVLVVGLIIVACALSLVALILIAIIVAHSLFGTMRLAGWLPVWAPIFLPLGIVASVVAAVVEIVALRLWRGDKTGSDVPSSREGMPAQFMRALSIGLVSLMLVETLAAGGATAAPLSLSGFSAASGSSASHPAHGTITVFPPIPGGVSSIAAGPDGNVWFLGAATFGSITPTGTVQALPYPNLLHRPSDLFVGPDHDLWFVASAIGSASPLDYIGKITSAGKLSEYALPPAHSFPSIQSVAAGPDGNVWYARTDGINRARVGRITPSGAVKEYDLSSSITDVGSIIAGSDGNLWFSYIQTSVTFPIPQFGLETVVGSGIGRLTPSGVIQEFSIPGPYYVTADLVLGPDGDIWFSEVNESTSLQSDKVQIATLGGKVGRITSNGTISQYTVPTAGNIATGLAIGPDHALWFTEAHQSRVSQFSGAGAHSSYTESNGKVGRISSTGTVSEYQSPGVNNGTLSLISGPDSNLWFAEPQGHRVGRISPAGTIAEYSTRPSEAQPFSIIVGPDHNIWFAANSTRGGGQTGYVGYIVP